MRTRCKLFWATWCVFVCVCVCNVCERMSFFTPPNSIWFMASWQVCLSGIQHLFARACACVCVCVHCVCGAHCVWTVCAVCIVCHAILWVLTVKSVCRRMRRWFVCVFVCVFVRVCDVLLHLGALSQVWDREVCEESPGGDWWGSGWDITTSLREMTHTTLSLAGKMHVQTHTHTKWPNNY